MNWTRFKFSKQNWNIMHKRTGWTSCMLYSFDPLLSNSIYYNSSFSSSQFFHFYFHMLDLKVKELFVLDAHSYSHFIWFAWHEMKENMRQTLQRRRRRRRRKDTDKTQSVASEAVAEVVFKRNLIGKTNFGLNWWNSARRICTEIAFHVRISAKPLSSTITRLALQR